MQHRLRAVLLAGVLAAAPLAAASCGVMQSVGLGPNEVDPTAVRRPAGTREEPPRVVVRHVLISFRGTKVPGVTRTKEEAERLAQKVLELAKSGRDFGDLVRLYTDDRGSDGTYAMSNWGVQPESDETPREGMVRGFGRTAFSLEPGEIGMTPYHSTESPFGWHILRRDR